MRKSDTFFIFLAIAFCLVVLTGVDAFVRVNHSSQLLQQREALVKDLGLTDLALFTEARYTRHLSQADLHTAFQDHPMGLEHFPSGSFVAPPQGLLK